MITFDDYQVEKFNAHPGELLDTHLLLVGNEMKKLGEKIDFDNANLGLIFFLVGFCHDFGKYTNIFQYYLSKSGIYNQDSIENVELLNNYKEHAIIGAFLYLYIIGKTRKGIDLGIENENLKVLAVLGFYAIAKHHGDLENLSNITDIEWLEKKITIVNKQLNYMNFEKIHLDFSIIFDKFGINIDLNEFKKFFSNKNIVNNFSNEFENIIKIMQNNIKYINLSKYIYSSLIYSDKYKTIFGTENIEISSKINNSKIVDYFKTIKGHSKTKNQLNKFRNKVYKTVSNSIKKIDLSNHIYTLNAPTGSGKTYNLFNIGFKLKSKLKKQGIKSKIIYGLPFTAIIDQVFEEISKVLQIMGVNSEDSKVLLKHHHLSNPKFDNIDNKNDLNEIISGTANYSKFMTNAWESEIIVTTFYQIFNTFFCNKNRVLIKMPNIQNAIFLLDEIQSTPYKYWGNFKDMFEQLAQEYNCYFVLSSATLPLIFDQTNSQELLTDNDKFFQTDQMNRTILDLSQVNKLLTLDEFNKDIKKSLIKNKKKTHLIVLNTIKSSLCVFDFLKQNIDFVNDELIYLSSNIIPKHRKQIINKIKSKNSKRLILVSTQIIEAGVDIDFDIGFRDLGPIDNIIQVLGRLNRNGNKKYKGVLNLYNIKDENNKKGKEYSSYIYDFLSLNITKNLLKNGGKIQEKNYRSLFCLYFDKINEFRSSDTENTIRENRNNLNFKNVCSEFNLINKSFATIDIFVNFDEESNYLLEKFNETRKIKNKWERKNQWDEIKNKFAQFVISVDTDRVKYCGFNAKQMKMGLVILKDTLLQEYYNPQTGFTNKGGKDLLDDNFI